ncbi:hypothetical protein [Frankia sp. QA3]|uniref:hypothetical protein n=1 Tax=Frankia sp. QA3 TaxID=710111 RepID=UPI000269B8B2|nr:hypothetical protein [Frankia sp. QA3]EIV90815.1 hypothetical protein FraQA3DRAFT_0221 [Frankia sp. QA3]
MKRAPIRLDIVPTDNRARWLYMITDDAPGGETSTGVYGGSFYQLYLNVCAEYPGRPVDGWVEIPVGVAADKPTVVKI